MSNALYGGGGTRDAFGGSSGKYLGAPAWSPKNAGATIWHDFSDAASLTLDTTGGTTTIQKVKNKGSGCGGLHAGPTYQDLSENTKSVQPALVAGYRNGLSAAYMVAGKRFRIAGVNTYGPGIRDIFSTPSEIYQDWIWLFYLQGPGTGTVNKWLFTNYAQYPFLKYTWGRPFLNAGYASETTSSPAVTSFCLLSVYCHRNGTTAGALGGTFSLYINGVLRGTKTTAGETHYHDPAHPYFYLFQDMNNTDAYDWNGYIGEHAFIPRATPDILPDAVAYGVTKWALTV